MTAPIAEAIPQEGGTWLRLPDGSLQRVPDEAPAPAEPAASPKKKPAAPTAQE